MQHIPLFDCRLDEAALEVLSPVLASGLLASGPNVTILERELGAYIGHPHVVALGDMTHALTLALQLAGVCPGDDVLTLAYNCLASNTAITQAGAIPVWIDIDPEHAGLSLIDCKSAITPRTKALLAYHVAGYPAQLDAIRAFCDTHKITLIEDANNALGARWSGRPIGTVGDFSVFSFYANRQVNAIEGAALVCPDEATAREASRLRRFGVDTQNFRDKLGEIDPHADVPRIGMSSPLNNVNATLALHALHSLDERLARNRSNVEKLSGLLKGLPSIRPVSWRNAAQPAFWTWLIRCDRRDDLMVSLKQRGIQCSKLHYPNDAYTGFGSRVRDLPATRRFMDEVLALPCGWWLSEEDIETMVEGLYDFYRP